MGYCPKCDMEFIDGITVCSDCGGELVDKELYDNEQKEKKANEFESSMEDHSLSGVSTIGGILGANEFTEDETLKSLMDISDNVPVYVKKSDKYDDLKSSASAFFIVGGLLVAFSIATWTSIIKLPFVGVGGIIFKSSLTVMGIGSLLVAITTNNSAEDMKIQVSEETKASKDLIQWFMDNYTPESIDAIIHQDSVSSLLDEELALKRMYYIQDQFVTHYGLSNQSYVDSLSEEVYSNIFEN